MTKGNLKMKRLILAMMAMAAAAATAAPSWEPTMPEKFPSGVKVPTLDETYPNFVVRDGDTARLERVFAKGLRGEPLVVAVIGGSITSGAKAGARERQWGYVLADWFRHVFPKSKVEYVNAGIGATGSAFACFRVEADVCAKGADVVGVEFAVNDPNSADSTEYNEGLVRHLLTSAKQPFVFQLSMVSKTRNNSQARHVPVSAHFDIPHFSYRDAFLPLFEAGKLAHKDLAKDELHPDEIGHPYMAALVCRYLNGKLAEFVAANRAPKAVPALPEKPLVGRSFDSGKVWRPLELKILENRGFVRFSDPKNHQFKDNLRGAKPGDRLVFEIDAPTCGMLHFRINGPMGRAKVTVDGSEPRILDGWFDQTWGGYVPYTLLWRDRPGRHVVALEIVEATSDKAGNGHLFELDAVLATGVGAKTYYVDSANGDDANDGLSETAAWKSLDRVNKAALKLKGGDKVLFRRGGLWRGTLRPGSGEKGNPLLYSTYGKGPKPIFQQSVDCSDPKAWFELEPGIWSTRRLTVTKGAVVWDGRASQGGWNGSFQEGAKGGVKVMDEDGVKFVRVTNKARAPMAGAHTLQLWGPLLRDLPDTAFLRLKVRATKPVELEGSCIRFSLQRPPWTSTLSGNVTSAEKGAVGTEWREFTALMLRPQGTDLKDGYFHWSIGDLVPDDVTLDVQFVELRTAAYDGSVLFDRDAGILILDHGEKWGVKRMWGMHELKDDLDFWYDSVNHTTVVKYPRNPGEAFRSIEIAKTVHVVSEGGCHDVTYDGLCVRYGAAHGFGGGSTENIVIRNCDIYWIGGGLQYWKTNAKGVRYPVRFGNGIEFWGACRNNLVERNRLWQIYDAALTNQTKDDPRHETDVIWRDNVIWQAEYSFEYWNHDSRSFTGNILFEHNTCVDAGYCWSHAQRPNPNGAHLMFYHNSAPTTNFVVRNNVFVRTTDRSTRMFNDWRMKNPAAKDGLDMRDNLYWMPENAVYEYHVAEWDRRMNPAAKSLRFGAGADEFAKYVAATGLDKGSVYVEPKFRDEAKRDYRLVDAPLSPDGTVYGARDIPGLD